MERVTNFENSKRPPISDKEYERIFVYNMISDTIYECL